MEIQVYRVMIQKITTLNQQTLIFKQLQVDMIPQETYCTLLSQCQQQITLYQIQALKLIIIAIIGPITGQALQNQVKQQHLHGQLLQSLVINL